MAKEKLEKKTNEKQKVTKKETKKVKKSLFKKSNKPKKEKKQKTPFLKEVKSELKKVKWPTKAEMLKYSTATLLFVVIFGAYFYGIDALFAWISSLVKGL